jgi:hypothetical protein
VRGEAGADEANRSPVDIDLLKQVLCIVLDPFVVEGRLFATRRKRERSRFSVFLTFGEKHRKERLP